MDDKQTDTQNSNSEPSDQPSLPPIVAHQPATLAYMPASSTVPQAATTETLLEPVPNKSKAWTITAIVMGILTFATVLGFYIGRASIAQQVASGVQYATLSYLVLIPVMLLGAVFLLVDVILSIVFIATTKPRDNKLLIPVATLLTAIVAAFILLLG